MRAFRIDNRPFLEGATILPQNLYQGTLKEEKVEVERILEANRPDNKPRRNSILMLFAEFEDAKKHWTIQRNAKFYKVEINEDQILHIGDFNKVEELFQNLDNKARVNQIAIEYWNGVMTEHPKQEIFVHEAPVYNIISDSEEERANAFKIRSGFGNPSIRVIIDEE